MTIIALVNRHVIPKLHNCMKNYDSIITVSKTDN